MVKKEEWPEFSNLEQSQQEKVEKDKILQEEFKQEEGKAKKSYKKTLNEFKKFKPGKVRDYEYLLDIFASDKSSLSYIKKTKKQLLEAGYEDSPTLNEYLFLSAISRRLQIMYQEQHLDANAIAEDFTLLGEIEKISEKKAVIQKTLDAQRETKAKTLDIVDLHQSMIKDAENEIREHIGEHSFLCKKCGTIVNTQGLPHWAIETTVGPDGSPIYFVFSAELWYLLKEKIIPPFIMAFILRTSIEGIIYTAKERGEKDIPTMDIQEEETKLRQTMDKYAENK